MEDNLRAQIDSNLSHLDALIKRGRRICESLVTDPADMSTLVANRAWQQDCGVAINQLSGGSKSHWLARAFSEAFLMRSPTGDVIDAVTPAEIAGRLVAVLEQGVVSLTRMRAGEVPSSAPSAAPLPRRFEFVHNRELRPVIERAYADSRDEFDRGNYGVSLTTSSGILEAIVTDALEHKGVSELAAENGPAGNIADWPFETRLAVAESAGLIRGGWVRLSEDARKYRELGGDDGASLKNVSEQDAKRAMQVLHVVMRDLDPGR